MALEGRGFTICGEAGTAQAAVEAAVEQQPDVCLLDVHMPGGGINAAREIVQKLPHSAVVMLTVSSEDSDMFEALLAGAAGYLLKDINPDRLPAALEGALNGEAAMPRNLTARLIEEFRVREGKKRLPILKRQQARLTSREWEVLQLLREGKKTSEIAEQLSVSKVTVRSHVAATLKKLKVKDRDEAVKLVQER